MFKDKPSDLHKCKFCLFREGPVIQDNIDPDIRRYYCTKRHTEVDLEKMTGYCGLFQLSPNAVPNGEADIVI